MYTIQKRVSSNREVDPEIQRGHMFVFMHVCPYIGGSISSIRTWKYFVLKVTFQRYISIISVKKKKKKKKKIHKNISNYNTFFIFIYSWVCIPHMVCRAGCLDSGCSMMNYPNPKKVILLVDWPFCRCIIPIWLSIFLLADKLADWSLCVFVCVTQRELKVLSCTSHKTR